MAKKEPKKSPQEQNAEKKIVVIGGGISGLTAGIYARLYGYQVEVYEQNAEVGGACTGWERKGCHIDNCIHWLSGTAPGSELHQLWETVGALGPEVEVYRPPYLYASELDGETIHLWADAQKTRQEMLALSPGDRAAIADLFHWIRLARRVKIPAHLPSELMTTSQMLKMAFTVGPVRKLFKHFRGRDTQGLAARFQHPLLRAVLTDFCTPESQGTSFPLAYGNYLAGDGGIPRGGSRAMALRMRARLESLGGVICTGKKVTKLNITYGKAVSISLEDGTEVAGDYFVPACDPSVLFYTLLDDSYMDEVFRLIYKRPKEFLIYSTFQVAVLVDSSVEAVEGEVNLPVGEIAPRKKWMKERMTVKTYGYEPSFASQGKQILQILYGGGEQGYAYFKELASDPAVYRRRKRELAEALVARVAERWPEYAGKMEILDIWTPVTYERYCSAYKGYPQACVPTKEVSSMRYPNPYLPGLRNVVMAGQWLSPPGGLPSAAIQGKFAIARIENKETVERDYQTRPLE